MRNKYICKASKCPYRDASDPCRLDVPETVSSKLSSAADGGDFPCGCLFDHHQEVPWVLQTNNKPKVVFEPGSWVYHRKRGMAARFKGYTRDGRVIIQDDPVSTVWPADDLIPLNLRLWTPSEWEEHIGETFVGINGEVFQLKLIWVKPGSVGYEFAVGYIDGESKQFCEQYRLKPNDIEVFVRIHDLLRKNGKPCGRLV